MSEKVTNSAKNAPKKSIFKWVLIVFIVSVLEAGAIFAAVKITESRSQNQFSSVDMMKEKISSLEGGLNKLATLSGDIQKNARQIAATDGELKVLVENFNTLKDEVGNKKVELLTKQLGTLHHRMESVEETKNQEALILGVALMIKENALYHKSFAQEVDILTELAQTQEQLQPSVQTLGSLKNSSISADDKLAQSYTKIMERFEFKTTSEQAEATEKGAVAKGFDLLKSKVTGINFDKVVMVKKDTKTTEQKQLVTQLTDLVKEYNFEQVLLFVEQNEAFASADNKDFNNWLAQVSEKVAFDKAISTIIGAELSAMREDFKNGVLPATSTTEQHQASSEND